MFTGIIEELGKVIRISRRAGVYELVVKSPGIYVEPRTVPNPNEALHQSLRDDTGQVSGSWTGARVNSSIGSSVAINGVCLTVTGKVKDELVFDIMEETVRKTTLSGLKAGDNVNLEDSLKAQDPVDGHFVTGHVDCIGKIANIKVSGKDAFIEIEFPPEFDNLAVKKGSIAIDGVSLTVGDVAAGKARLYLIPHTLKVTTLGSMSASDNVNIEFDILGKYAAKQKTPGRENRITEGFLKDNGFI